VRTAAIPTDAVTSLTKNSITRDASYKSPTGLFYVNTKFKIKLLRHIPTLFYKSFVFYWMFLLRAGIWVRDDDAVTRPPLMTTDTSSYCTTQVTIPSYSQTAALLVRTIVVLYNDCMSGPAATAAIINSLDRNNGRRWRFWAVSETLLCVIRTSPQFCLRRKLITSASSTYFHAA